MYTVSYSYKLHALTDSAVRQISTAGNMAVLKCH